MQIGWRHLRIGVLWLVIFVTVFVVAGALLLESGVLTPTIVEEANRRLASEDVKVTASSLTWRPWSGLILDEVELTRPSAPADSARLVAVDRLEVAYRFSEILFGRRRVARVRILGPRIDLERIVAWNGRERPARPAAEEGGGPDLPPLVVRDLEIRNGQLMAGDALRLDTLDLTGDLEGERASWRVRVEDASSRLRTSTIDETVELTGDVVLDGEVVSLDGLHLEAAGGRVSFEGHVDPTGGSESSLLVRGFSIPLARIGEWTGTRHPLMLTDLEMSLLATGRPDSLRLSGEFAGAGADGVNREIHFSGTRRGDRLDMEAFHLKAGASLVDLSGTMEFTSPPHLEGVAVFRNVEPAVALADPDLSAVSDVDGAIRFDGEGLSRDSFRGTAEIRLSRLSVFDFELQGGSAKAQFDRGDVTLEHARFERGSSYLEGEGTISARNLVEATFRGEVADLADLGASADDLSTAALKGKAQAEIHVSGPLASPALQSRLEFAQAAVLGGVARKLRVEATTDRIGDSPLEVTITGEGVGFGRQSISRATAQGTYLDGRLGVRRLVLQSRGRGQLLLTGELDVLENGNLDGRVAELEIRSPDESVVWRNEGPVRIEKTERSLTFSGLALSDGRGRIDGDVSVHESGEAFVRLAAHGVELSVFSPYLLLDKPLGGVLEADVTAIVGADTLTADASFELADGTWGDETLREVRGVARIRDDYAQFDDVVLRSASSNATLNGRIDLPGGSFRVALTDSASRASILDRMVFHDVQAHLESVTFDWLWNRISVLPAMDGSGSATLLVDGPILKPSALIEVQLTDAELTRRSVDWVSATASYDGERLTITDGVIRSGAISADVLGSLPVKWSFQTPIPKCPPGEPFDLRMQVHEFPIGELETFVPFFASVRGAATGEVALVGTCGDLSFEGPFRMTDAELILPVFRDPIQGGTIEGKFVRDGVEFVSAKFETPAQGTMEGDGRIQLENLRPAGFDVHARATRFRYRGVDNGIEATGSGKLDMTTGVLRDGKIVPNFTGDFEVQRADLDEQLIRPRAVIEMPVGVQAPPETGAQAGGALEPLMLAALRFRADRNVWLRTPEIETEAAIDVTFHVTEDYLGITGEARSLRGNYQVFNSRFDIDKAEIEFTDPRNLGRSYLDAEASTRVLDEEVTATVTGPLEDPVIELATQSGMTEEEIYELLALRIKRDPADASAENPGVLSNALQRSYLAALGNRFGRELSRQFGLDTFDVETVETGSSSFTGSVSVGKTFGRDFYVRYKQNVIREGEGTTNDPTLLESPEQSLVLEYYLNRIFTLQGETGAIQGDQYLNVDLRAEFGY